MSAIHKLLPVFALMLNLVLLGAALAANGRSRARNRAFARLAAALAVWSFAATGLRWSEAPATALVTRSLPKPWSSASSAVSTSASRKM